MIRTCLCLLLIGCVDAAEPAPIPVPAPVPAPHVAPPTPPPALPQIIDLSNDVMVIVIDCDDPAVHCRQDDDDDDDIPARVVNDRLVVVGDRDGDGVPDAVDKCPDAPEDVDGFEDTDGCPDPDTDRDPVMDVADRCPGVPDGDNDDIDGCPEPAPPPA